MKKILYRVKNVDTLLSVCKKFKSCPLSVIDENMLDCEILEGDMLVITEGEELYSVMPMDTYFSVAKKLNIKEDFLRKLNKTPYLFYGLTIRIK